MEPASKLSGTAKRERMSRRACPQCEGPVALDSPHVRISPGGISVYCSIACLQGETVPILDLDALDFETDELAPRRRASALKASPFALALVVASLSPCAGLRERVKERKVSAAPKVPALEIEHPEMLGPPPPTEADLAAEFANSLGQNGWVHPLPGPNRRMPVRKSRAFGAERPGHRPFECRSGHCGVDIGGVRWGEPILASSDAVVAKVNRDPSRSGGLYVRLSHLDGMVFTQYFHLAAIPKQLRAGKRVRAGEIIGLLGETGIEHSEAHLHYTFSVKSSPDAEEVYVDPEPLIALWPMRDLQRGLIASSRPGVPIGATGRYKGKSERRSSRVSSAVESLSEEPIAEPPAAAATRPLRPRLQAPATNAPAFRAAN